MSARPTLTEQIACVRRELALRRNVYPKFILQGRMTPDKAVDEIDAMEAVLRTLEALINDRKQTTGWQD
jgi:hypothetical protein